MASPAAIEQGIERKSRLQRVAEDMLRETPEYAAAVDKGTEEQWLREESESAAEMLYAAMKEREKDLEQP